MAIIIALNFRATLAYVTDPADTVFLGGEGGAGAGADYPTSKNSGNGAVNVGYLGSALVGNLRDRDNAAGHEKIAGTQWASGNWPISFKVELPATGTYRIRLALGDPAGGAGEISTKIYDGTTSGTLLATIGPVSLSSGQFRDASNTTRASAAAWLSDNAYAEFSFSTTTLTVTLERDLASISHLSVESVAASGAMEGTAAGTSSATLVTGSIAGTATGTSAASASYSLSAGNVIIALNFRATLAGATDPAGTVFLGGEGGAGFGAEYPTSKNSGAGATDVGYLGSQLVNNLRDRISSGGRLAGTQWATGGSFPISFRVNLPAAGTYRIRLALGDPNGGAGSISTKIYDGSTAGTLLQTIGPLTNSSGQFTDATGVTRTSAADWLSNNAYFQGTFANSFLTVTLERNQASISHLSVESIADVPSGSISGSTAGTSAASIGPGSAPVEASTAGTSTAALTANASGLLVGSVRSPGVVELDWDDNTEIDLVGYRVYYGTAPGTYGTGIDVGLVSTYTFTGLASGQTYYFAVKAYDTEALESSFSNEVSYTIPVYSLPTATLTGNTENGALSGVARGGSSPGTVEMDWDDNTEPDLAGYRIYIGLAPGVYGGTYAGYVSPVDVGLVSTFTFKLLPGGQTYYFAVKAYDAQADESPFSAELSVAVEPYSLPTGTLSAVTLAVGTAVGVSAATGSLLAASALSGTAAGTSDATAVLFGVSTAFRSGSTVGTSAAAATLTGTGALAGVSAGTGLASHSGIYGTATGSGLAVGSLIGLAATSGSGVATGAGTASATLIATGTLSGQAIGTSLARHSGIYGTAAGVGAVNGSLIGLAATSGAGVIAGLATVTGSLLGAGALVGASAGTSSLTDSSIYGTAAGTSNATASLGAENVAAGVAAGVGAVSATLLATGALVGQSDGTSLLRHSGIRGTAAGTSFATALLFGASTSSATGISIGTATATATLRGVGALAGVAAGTSLLRDSVIYGSSAGVGFAEGSVFGISTSTTQGQSNGVSFSVATLTGTGALAGQSDGTSSSTDSSLTGTAAGAGHAEASLDGLGSTGAVALTQGTGLATAELTATGALAGQSDGIGFALAPGAGGILPVDGTGVGVGLASATLVATADLAGIIIGSGAASADSAGNSLIFGTASGVALLSSTLLGSGRLAGISAGSAPIVTLVRQAQLGQMGISRMRHSKGRPDNVVSPRR